MGGSFDTDSQYTTERVKTAEPSDCSGPGWTLTFENGWSLWCTAAQCAVAPQPGEEARLYGKGLGYPVRGIVIGGRVYHYITEEQEADRHAKQCEQMSIEREAAAVKHAEEIARGEHAPVAFRLKESARADYEKGLANNTDPYGRCCYLYAAEWAALMEKAIGEGKSVADVAKAAGQAADKTHGVTGFMYGVAVNILAHCWEHGEELRRWHNLDAQMGKEGERANESGGVLNPALMNIG